MSNRFREALVVLACVAMVLTYGVGASEARSSPAAGGAVVATEAPPACAFSVFASGLTLPGPMIFRGTDLYVATYAFSTDQIQIVKFTSAGTSGVFATIDASGSAAPGGAYPTDLAFDGSGNLYLASGSNYPGKYWKVAPDGAVSSASSGTGRGPSSIEFDSAGNMYLTDAYADIILKNGAPFVASSEDIAFSNGLLWDASTLYAQFLSTVQRVSATGRLTLVVDLGTGNSPMFALQPGTANFYFLNADGSPDLVAKVTPSGSPTMVCDLGFDDNGVAPDMEFGADGALYLSDWHGRILKIAVPNPSHEVQSLVDEVNGLNVPSGTKNSLNAKLDAALESIGTGATGAATGKLKAFINEVNARCCVPDPGKTLTQDEADALIAAAESILASLA